MDKLILLTKPLKANPKWSVPFAYQYVSTNKYKPHQGKKEIARPQRQLAAGIIRTN